MKKRYYLWLPLYSTFFVGLGVYELSNFPFSSDSVKIGNYQIQIGTTPAIPEVGKDTTIHFHVLDENGKGIDAFRMGLHIYSNEDLIRSFPPSDHNFGTWDLNYVFQESGNHIIKVDLFNLKTDQPLSYLFNVTVLNFYGTIFTSLIVAGVTGAVGILFAIFLFKTKSKTKKRRQG